MLKKYSCSLIPNLTDKYFTFFTDHMISHNMKKRDSILDKWFYFYMNEPIQPVIIWIKQNYLRLEPGTTRYVGTALRQCAHPILGIAIIEDNASIPENITIIDYIEESNLSMDISDKLDEKSPLCKWAIGSTTTLNSNDWWGPALKWIKRNVKHTHALEYKGKQYYLNQRKKMLIFPSEAKIVVKVENYDKFEYAVIDLFKQVCLYEGINYLEKQSESFNQS